MQVDTDFFGLRNHGQGRYAFTVEDHLARLDGKLYGGTAIGVSVATAEHVTERSPLWMTTQFVSTVGHGATVEVQVEVLAPGRRTNQVRVTGTAPDGQVVFASLGATGHHRAEGVTGEFESMPTVSAPDDAASVANPFAAMAEAAGVELGEGFREMRSGFATAVEMRSAIVEHHPDPGPGRTCLWIRRRDRGTITPAIAAYLADMVPMSIARAAAVMAGGTSLDNTIRIGDFTPTEWLLVDLRPHLAVGDYGHGIAHLWSEDGHLLGTASQTASMIRFDPDNPPWVAR